jgi:hypothetical protein
MVGVPAVASGVIVAVPRVLPFSLTVRPSFSLTPPANRPFIQLPKPFLLFGRHRLSSLEPRDNLLNKFSLMILEGVGSQHGFATNNPVQGYRCLVLPSPIWRLHGASLLHPTSFAAPQLQPYLNLQIGGLEATPARVC